MSTASTSTAVDGNESTTTTTRSSQRPRKRAKANDTTGRPETRTVRAPKLGRLSQLMSIPLDILMEIFGHLHPLDLLHLARTTKAFRRVLMHRSSIFVWKAALSTVPDLPDCPPELSEPQWANLAFDAHCSLCLRSNIRNVDWVLRVRLCAACTKQHITNGFSHTFSTDHATRVVPCRYDKRGYPEFLRNELQKVHARYCAIQDPDACREFVAERRQLVERIQQHAKLCVVWANAQALVRSDELDRLRSSRHQAIVDKLTALGWGDEIKKIPVRDALTTHKLVKAPQLLTDRIWANISGPMIEYMEKMKVNRLARDLEKLRPQRMLDVAELLRRYKTKCAPFTNVMPELLDVCAFGPIKEIIEQPPDVAVDSASFFHLMSKLDDLVEEWRRTVLMELINEVKVGVVKHSNASHGNPLDLDAPLADEPILHRMQLACIVFTCISCRDARGADGLFTQHAYATASSNTHPTTSQRLRMKLLWYPRVLGHRCLTKPRLAGVPTGAIRLDAIPCYRRRWWCNSVIKVDEAASKAAVGVVRACEMDPRNATVEEMDGLDARVECLACLERDVEDPSHVVFGWRSAVRHQRERHSSDPGDWRLLIASEAELARAEEGKWESISVTPKPMVPSDMKVWLCLHCIDGPAEGSWATLEAVREHVKRSHGVEDPGVDRDYVKDFAAPELYATSTMFKAAVVKFPGGDTSNL